MEIEILCYICWIPYLSSLDSPGGVGGDFEQQQQREFPPYQRGPPLSYMERIEEKRILEEVYMALIEANCDSKYKVFHLWWHSSVRKIAVLNFLQSEDVDFNADIHGNWTLENAKSRLHQFLQQNKIQTDYKYSMVGPDHNRWVTPGPSLTKPSILCYL